MDTSKILAELRAERDQINQAIAALQTLGGTARAAKAAKAAPVKTKPGTGKRAMSRAGRNRIAEAARKRWAAVRSAKTAPAAAPAAKGARQPMSAATKQKLAKAAKIRWAKRKAKLVKPEAKPANAEASANQVATAQTASKRAKGTRRNLTAAARKAMSDAAKARWTNKTAAAKTS
jgi:hypothetical protein